MLSKSDRVIILALFLVTVANIVTALTTMTWSR